MMKKHYIRNIIVSAFVILIVPVVIVTGAVLLLDVFISTDVQWQTPSSGIWYCDELNMQLHFRRNLLDSDEIQELPDTMSYVIIEDGCVKCRALRTRDPHVLKVADSKKQIFKGETVGISEKEYKVSDKRGRIYTFTRIEEFSLEEIMNTYASQIVQHDICDNVGKVPHITLAIEKACDLWRSELGVDLTEGEKFVVAFDPKAECWFVSITRDLSPMALIDTDGNVIGFWETREQGDGSLVSAPTPVNICAPSTTGHPEHSRGILALWVC